MSDTRTDLEKAQAQAVEDAKKSALTMALAAIKGLAGGLTLAARIMDEAREDLEAEMDEHAAEREESRADARFRKALAKVKNAQAVLLAEIAEADPDERGALVKRYKKLMDAKQQLMDEHEYSPDEVLRAGERDEQALLALTGEPEERRPPKRAALNGHNGRRRSDD